MKGLERPKLNTKRLEALNLYSQRKALAITLIALCAALYAVGCLTTAWIVSPWGRGQFRPAVVIPAVFAVISSSPIVPALGAAIGTLIADSIKHGCLYIPSLVAAVPGNFLGFYTLSWFIHRKFSWRVFIGVSALALALGCFIVAFLYVPTIYLLGFLPPTLSSADLALFASALTIWFFITEYPFVILLTPPIAKAVSYATPSIVSQDIALSSIRGELPRRDFALALLAPGIALLAIGLSVSFTPIGSFFISGLAVKFTPAQVNAIAAATTALLITWGAVMSGAGAIVFLTSKRR
ncbi:MAG: hypothetical protein DRJ33_01610 [Candidatus Methanomethylicota archaeon]|mgnify:FL=1|uniref:QueT transporter family protein n=1 Tax=Thermoproteota archaeon TaxID=2056631 RepID=A0A497F1P0_9CREN|nr:MAG: hypothetical protein DRJ33_01610 [Candidatus Verstraetearchaeota archaeon]